MRNVPNVAVNISVQLREDVKVALITKLLKHNNIFLLLVRIANTRLGAIILSLAKTNHVLLILTKQLGSKMSKIKDR